MSVFRAGRLSLSAAVSLIALSSGLVGAASSAIAQARPDLDALIYGKSSEPAQPQPAISAPHPAAARLTGGQSSSGGALAALAHAFNPSRRQAYAQMSDAAGSQEHKPSTSGSPKNDVDIRAYGAPPRSAITQRGLFTGSRFAPSTGALAAFSSGFRSSPREAFARAPLRYAAPPPILVYDPTYRLDAGDRLRIVVYGQDGLTNTYSIDAGGSITMPLIGAVTARGQTPASLASHITARLRDGYIRQPSVAVEIEAYRPFFILGEVAAPGQYPYVPRMSIESAVAIAGGFSPRAKRDRVTLTHPTAEGLLRAVVPVGMPLSPGDTILVGERWF